ncbi:hypothetical protein [Aeromicrobium fastidiosum]|uniref:Uncharacterized protein n=1 Tax=Aeromicrobium fastidiosum TaxID=52699 RepID=A0A641AN47_9ACTN|nr:hypothetical protein [Aeromicrobium fastidiosum]KAA1378700.1 hypothetical protein ESP62_010210 [Aeromicrobium fastidiosum]MBP2392313.1 hypothetical protein [Aeromicrobium fastidiosum]
MPDLSTTPSVRPAVAPRRLAIATLVTLLAGVVAGLVWVWLAQPAEWLGRDGGIVLTEAASRGQFSVIVVFVAVGAVASLVSGVVTARLVPDLGWLAVPVAAALVTVAGLVAWRVGVELGPPPPGTVAGVGVGDKVPSQLAVDGVAPFLVWPIFGVLGVIVASWAGDRGADDQV